jgi:hypothetical protein
MTFTGVPNVGDTSGNPYVVLGNQIAVLDRAGFVLGDDMALALAGDIAEAPAPRFAACLPDDDLFGNQVPGDERPAEDCATQGYITGLGGFGGQAAVWCGCSWSHSGSTLLQGSPCGQVRQVARLAIGCPPSPQLIRDQMVACDQEGPGMAEGGVIRGGRGDQRRGGSTAKP